MTDKKYLTVEDAKEIHDRDNQRLKNLKVESITIGNIVLREEQVSALLALLDKEESR